MAADSSFRTYYNPITFAKLTNSSCVFANSIIGSDSNDGTREFPVLTWTKARSLCNSTKNNILVKGNFSSENYIGTSTSFTLSIIADEIGTYINSIYDTSANQYMCNLIGLKINSFTIPSNAAIYKLYNSYIINSVGYGYSYPQFDKTTINCVFINLSIQNYNDDTNGSVFKNNTIHNYKNYLRVASAQIILDCIFSYDFDLYNYTSLTTTIYPTFKNCILRKALLWKWNGTNVPITYTTATGNISTDSEQWKTDVFNGLTAYYNSLGSSTSKTYLGAILSNWSTIFPSTTIIVDDINCCPIFNKYVDGSPVDYSLKISDTNPALTMSSVGSHVGAYLASITPVYDNTTLKELDSNGAETANTPDILLVGSQGNIYPSPSATQYRNRIKTNVLTYPRGYSFSNGVQSMLTSGLSARYQYGKRQTYTTVYTPQEGIHVEAFDNPTTRSSFPLFTAKLNGATQIWYHANGAGTVAITTGGVITGTGTAFTTNFVVGQMIYVGNEGHAITAINSATSMNVASWSVAVAAGSSYASVPTNKLNTPILFSDLATYYNISSDLNMTEYGAWAVSNADYETYLLSSKTGVTLRTPFLKYLKFWIEINYYD